LLLKDNDENLLMEQEEDEKIKRNKQTNKLKKNEKNKIKIRFLFRSIVVQSSTNLQEIFKSNKK